MTREDLVEVGERVRSLNVFRGGHGYQRAKRSGSPRLQSRDTINNRMRASAKKSHPQTIVKSSHTQRQLQQEHIETGGLSYLDNGWEAVCAEGNMAAALLDDRGQITCPFGDVTHAGPSGRQSATSPLQHRPVGKYRFARPFHVQPVSEGRAGWRRGHRCDCQTVQHGAYQTRVEQVVRRRRAAGSNT